MEKGLKHLHDETNDVITIGIITSYDYFFAYLLYCNFAMSELLVTPKRRYKPSPRVPRKAVASVGDVDGDPDRCDERGKLPPHSISGEK